MRRRHARKSTLEVLEVRSLLSGGASLTVALNPSTVVETAGPDASTGTVTRSNTDNSLALTVSLKSSDKTQATVPSSVTIPAGKASATFPVNVLDDGGEDGTSWRGNGDAARIQLWPPLCQHLDRLETAHDQHERTRGAG